RWSERSPPGAQTRPPGAHAPGSPDLVAAHLNHRLRPDADADERFVQHLAASLDIPCVCHALDIRALAAGDNIEAAARRERYAWLASVARERGLTRVATGHTASDQAETVLHRLLRGTGLDGLRGIAARRPLGDGVELVRPLLGVSRSDVLAYLAEVGQSARHDATNDDTSLTRNRIRHELLPLLARDYNPRVEGVLAGLAAQAEEAFADVAGRAAVLLGRAERPRDGATVVLDAAALGGASGRVLRGALRRVWRREGWPMGEMGAGHWRGVEAVCRGAAPARDLPGGVTARGARALVFLGR
ncbi:MAG: tRNA lysidine(34) synthetase TilS, partial [Gemmataceae bacterium]